MSVQPADAGVIVVDARGHRCPVPSLRLRRALEACLAGGEVELMADNPLARIDVPHLVRTLGYQLISSEVRGAELIFKIRKAPGATTVGEDPSN